MVTKKKLNISNGFVERCPKDVAFCTFENRSKLVLYIIIIINIMHRKTIIYDVTYPPNARKIILYDVSMSLKSV